MNIETQKEKEKRNIRNNLLKKIQNIKLIVEILEKEIQSNSYDKISDSIANLNTSIASFLSDLKKF